MDQTPRNPVHPVTVRCDIVSDDVKMTKNSIKWMILTSKGRAMGIVCVCEYMLCFALRQSAWSLKIHACFLLGVIKVCEWSISGLNTLTVALQLQL